MHFKLIIAFVEDNRTTPVMDAARKAGATGATIINNARGEGIKRKKTFLGLELETQRDMLLFMVEEHSARMILETIAKAGHFDDGSGRGIAFQVDIEDAVGVAHQVKALSKRVEEQL